MKAERAENERKMEEVFCQLSGVKKALAVAEESVVKSEQQIQEKAAKLDSLGKANVKLEADLQAKVCYSRPQNKDIFSANHKPICLYPFAGKVAQEMFVLNRKSFLWHSRPD